MTRPLALPTDFDIPIDKLTKFLLNREGRKPERAAFFLRLGFDPDRPEELAEAVYRHASLANHVGSLPSAFGYSVLYEGSMTVPRGVADDIRSVWPVDDDSRIGLARFITAYRYR